MSSGKSKPPSVEFFAIRYQVHARSIDHLGDMVTDLGLPKLMKNRLKESLKLVGRYAVNQSIGPTLTLRDIHRGIRTEGLTPPTVRRHAELLIDSGELVQVGPDTYRLRLFYGRNHDGPTIKLPGEETFWARYKKERDARRRSKGAARSRNQRRNGKRLSPPLRKSAAITAEYGGVTPLSFKAFSDGHLCPQNNASPLSYDDPDEAPVEASVDDEAPQFVGARARLAPAQITEPEIEAVERELLGEAPPAAPFPENKPLSPFYAMIPADIRARLEAGEKESEPERPVFVMPKVTAPAPRRQATPSRRKPRPGVIPAIARLAEERGIDGLNIKAVERTGAPLPIIVQAFGVVADALREPHRDHGPVRDPPRFLLGTVRKMILGGQHARPR